MGQISHAFHELVATSFFVIVSCLASLNKQTSYGAGTVSGMVVTAIIYLFGNTAPAHVNPAVTLACCFRGFMKIQKAILLIISQCLGALLGYNILLLTLPNEWVSGSPPLCVTVANDQMEWHQIFSMETLHVCFILLSWEIMWNPVYVNQAGVGPITVGCVFGSCSGVLMKYTGCSLNLARSLAGGFIQDNFKHIDAYIYAHMTAVVACSFFFWIALKKYPKGYK